MSCPIYEVLVGLTLVILYDISKDRKEIQNEKENRLGEKVPYKD